MYAGTQPATASVIWLHGLGADGYDFAPIIKRLNCPHIRFILPHAPEMPVTRNNGYVMPAWYDVYGLTGFTKEDETGIRQTQAYIESLIANEIRRGIRPEKIAIAGFSQGGAIALQTALRFPQALAGVLALSTYLPLRGTLHTEAHAANKPTPILMAHGSFDEIITLETCQNSLKILQEENYPVEFYEYPMAHSVCEQEIADIQAFLDKILPA
jgi:phospholipase/carboxylesterase